MENQSTQHTAGLTSDSTEFSRDITLFGGISILAGIMIGSGVFYLGSYVLISRIVAMSFCEPRSWL